MKKIGLKMTLGFTLIELMVTIAIIGILSAVATPAYLEYVKKARYVELINMSSPIKTAVDVCYQRLGNLNNCSGGQNGVPANIIGSNQTLANIILTIRGQIYVFPNTRNGFNLLLDYYILSPTAVNNQLVWSFSGPGATKGYVN